MKTRFYTRVFPNDETTQRRIIQGCLLLLLSTLSFRKTIFSRVIITTERLSDTIYIGEKSLVFAWGRSEIRFDLTGIRSLLMRLHICPEWFAQRISIGNIVKQRHAYYHRSANNNQRIPITIIVEFEIDMNLQSTNISRINAPLPSHRQQICGCFRPLLRSRRDLVSTIPPTIYPNKSTRNVSPHPVLL